MFDYSEQHVVLITQTRGQLSINSIASYAHDAFRPMVFYVHFIWNLMLVTEESLQLYK